ncbi:MAG: hypothetical protein ACRBDI_10805 [Alphaproteobacteria bacterium]
MPKNKGFDLVSEAGREAFTQKWARRMGEVAVPLGEKGVLCIAEHFDEDDVVRDDCPCEPSDVPIID